MWQRWYCRGLACAWRRRFAESRLQSARRLRAYGSRPRCKSARTPRCPRAGGEGRSASPGAARAVSCRSAARLPCWSWKRRLAPRGWGKRPSPARREPGACNPGVHTWRLSRPGREALCAPCSGSPSSGRRRAGRRSRTSGTCTACPSISGCERESLVALKPFSPSPFSPSHTAGRV